MSLTFSVPGKTFLAGEYLALSGGPTLVFASEPRFQMKVKPGTGQVEGIHPDSPAGLYIKKSDYFQKFDLSFVEAYDGRGGFGASTAQFLAAYALNTWRDSAWLEPQQLIDYKFLLDCYFQVAWNGQGQRPSGADVIGQLKGSLTLFEKSLGRVSQLSWSFDDLDFVLVHTGNKVATHEHLKTLKPFENSFLRTAFSEIHRGLESGTSEVFVKGVNHYADALAQLQFTCAPSLDLLKKIKKIPGVVATKGCGALGADVLFVVAKKDAMSGVKAALAALNLNMQIDRSAMSHGLDVQVLGSSI